MGSTSMASLWKLERAQTRLRMSRSQVRFWCKLTLLLWLCGAVVYFLVGIGVVGRLQLGLWLWASLWAGVWPAKVVFYEGQYYYAGQFAPWLTASVYGQPVAAWVWESIGWGTLPAVALVVALFVWLHWRSEAEQAGGQHVRGVHLLEGKALQTKLWGVPLVAAVVGGTSGSAWGGDCRRGAAAPLGEQPYRGGGCHRHESIKNPGC